MVPNVPLDSSAQFSPPKPVHESASSDAKSTPPRTVHTEKPASTSPSPSNQTKKQVSTASKKKGKKQASKKAVPRGQKEIEPSRVIEIQNALAAAGYYQEEPSGKWDDSTSQAMSAYQESNGFKVTGKPDALSLKKLGL